MESKTWKTQSGGSIKVTASIWKEKRIYFKFDEGRAGNACWDLQSKSWVGVHKEIGVVAKLWLKKQYNLE